jgi:hypothetical protein
MPRHKYNKNKRRRGKKQGNLQQQVARKIPLQSGMDHTTARCNSITPVYDMSTTGNWSFVNSTDQRFFTFSTMISNALVFTQLSNAYEEYKIKSLTVYLAVNAYHSTTLTSSVVNPALFISCDPNVAYTASPANPTNNEVLQSPNSYLYPSSSVQVKSFTFTFPSVGQSTQIWYSTSNLNIGGALYIGGQLSGFLNPGDLARFDMVTSLQVEFRTLRTH